MEFLGSLLITGFTMAGLGAWVPLASHGARLLVGGALITITFFLANYVAHIPLSLTAYALAIVAVTGLALGAWRLWRETNWIGIAIHPVVVFPVLFVLVSTASGYSGYTVFAGDEYGNWLIWTREAWWYDTVRHPDMHWRHLVYTQGWPTTLIYPQLFFGSFEIGRSLIVIFLWHVGLLGLVYDLVVRMMGSVGGFSRARAVAWSAILALLAVEATWTLLPQHLLIEKPQIYLMAGILCLAGLSAFEGGANRAVCLAIGILMATAYLLKVTTLGFVPAVALIACLPAFRGSSGWAVGSGPAAGELGVRISLMLGPLLAVFALWNGLLPFQRTGCIADPFAVFDVAAQGRGNRSVLSVFVGQVGAYLWGFKLPLTVLSAAGLLLAFGKRKLVVIAAPLALYTVIYLASLYVLYAVCFQGYERETFASLQRYVRIPLRMIHLYGPLMLVFIAAPLLPRALQLIGHRWSGRAVFTGLATIAIVTLMGYQAQALVGAMRNVVIRDRAGQSHVAAMTEIATDAKRLRVLVARQGLDRPRVALIAQGRSGFEFHVAHYWSLKDRRGGQPIWYRMTGGYSWGPAKSNLWMIATSADKLRAHFAAQDILWPHRVDDWIVRILKELTGDAGCARDATRHFFVPTGQASPVMRCVAKDKIDPGGGQR